MIVMKTAAQNTPGEEGGQLAKPHELAQGDSRKSQNTTTDFAVAGVDVAMTFPEPSDKIKATLTARFALAGWALNEAPSGGFTAARWNRCVDFEHLDAAAAFIDKVEGRHE